MQQFVHMQGLAALALGQFGNRNTGPLRNNPGNLILGDTLMYLSLIHIYCRNSCHLCLFNDMAVE